MRMWCTCDAHVMHMWCTCDAHVMHMWCTCDAHVMRMWCSCDAHVMHMWWNVMRCDAHVMKYDTIWCTCDRMWCACNTQVMLMWWKSFKPFQGWELPACVSRGRFFNYTLSGLDLTTHELHSQHVATWPRPHPWQRGPFVTSFSSRKGFSYLPSSDKFHFQVHIYICVFRIGRCRIKHGNVKWCLVLHSLHVEEAVHSTFLFLILPFIVSGRANYFEFLSLSYFLVWA
jgi:hypothetical protein